MQNHSHSMTLVPNQNTTSRKDLHVENTKAGKILRLVVLGAGGGGVSHHHHHSCLLCSGYHVITNHVGTHMKWCCPVKQTLA